MTREKIHEEVQDVFRNIFDDEEIVVTDSTNADDIEDWDSLAQVRLTVAIEKRFDIKFAFGELTNLQNVGGMLKVIEQKVNARVAE